jgi:hypothetical protein
MNRDISHGKTRLNNFAAHGYTVGAADQFANTGDDGHRQGERSVIARYGWASIDR